jgi:hypothetical protein
MKSSSLMTRGTRTRSLLCAKISFWCSAIGPSRLLDRGIHAKRENEDLGPFRLGKGPLGIRQPGSRYQVEKLVAHQQFDQKARVSLNTVKDHLKSIFCKFDAHGGAN